MLIRKLVRLLLANAQQNGRNKTAGTLNKFALPGSLFLLLLVVVPATLQAQQDTIAVPAEDSLTVQQETPADTLIRVQQETNDTLQTRQKQSYQPFKQTKSALLSVGLSIALPGAGQFYNEDYWKVPVIWGLGGYWVYEWVTLHKNYKDYRDKYAASVIEDPPGDQRLLDNRNFYRDERDKFAWYLGVLYFLNVVDAYVGANLYDFEVTPDLNNQNMRSYQVRAVFRARF